MSVPLFVIATQVRDGVTGLPIAPAAGTVPTADGLGGATWQVNGGSVSLASTGGTSLVVDGSGPSLTIKGLTGGQGITVDGSSPTSVSIAANVAAIANEGGGAGVFDSVVSGTANLRSLVGTTNGSTVTQNATTITVDNTLTGANVGGGAGLFRNKTTNLLNLRSLIAGSGIGITAAADTLSIALGLHAWRISDEKASGTNGGLIGVAPGENIRTLNTIVAFTGDASVTLVGGSIVAVPGTYLIWARAPAIAFAHRISLAQTSPLATVTLFGSNAANTIPLLPGAGPSGITESHLFGMFTASVLSTYSIFHFCNSPVGPADTAFGVNCGEAGVNERYTDVFIVRVQ